LWVFRITAFRDRF
ncbi:GTP-binding protein LepA, partial [Chlamydia psittaci 03DC29]